LREKLSISTKIKQLRDRNPEASAEVEALERRLSTDRQLHPEPAPNSLINSIRDQFVTHRIVKIDKSALLNARNENPNEKRTVDHKKRLD